MIQIAKLTSEFFRRFDISLVDPSREWKIHGSWITKQTDMDMWVQKLRPGT